MNKFQNCNHVIPKLAVFILNAPNKFLFGAYNEKSRVTTVLNFVSMLKRTQLQIKFVWNCYLLIPT